jgi:hypothetical protein
MKLHPRGAFMHLKWAMKSLFIDQFARISPHAPRQFCLGLE